MKLQNSYQSQQDQTFKIKYGNKIIILTYTLFMTIFLVQHIWRILKNEASQKEFSNSYFYFTSISYFISPMWYLYKSVYQANVLFLYAFLIQSSFQTFFIVYSEIQFYLGNNYDEVINHNKLQFYQIEIMVYIVLIILFQFSYFYFALGIYENNKRTILYSISANTKIQNIYASYLRLTTNNQLMLFFYFLQTATFIFYPNEKINLSIFNYCSFIVLILFGIIFPLKIKQQKITFIISFITYSIIILVLAFVQLHLYSNDSQLLNNQMPKVMVYLQIFLVLLTNFSQIYHTYQIYQYFGIEQYSDLFFPKEKLLSENQNSSYSDVYSI